MKHLSAGAGAAVAAAPQRPLHEAHARRRGLLLVAGAATVWSTGGLIVREVATDSWTTVFWRATFCAVFLIGYIALMERRRFFAAFRAVGLPGLQLALCFAVASTTFVMSLAHTSVVNVLIIQSTSPFIAGLLGLMLMGERVRPRSWAAMVCALAGIAVMLTGSSGQGSWRGDLLAMIVPFAFAMAVVTVRRHPTVRMTPAVALAAIIQGCFALTMASPGAVSGHDLALLAFFGAGQLGLGLVLFVAGARLLPAAETALLAMLENILGPLWVWFFVGEDPGTYALLGGAVVLGALAVHTVLDMRPPPRAVPPMA
jgi:drug/metabolite transporter (DMT)-like permease